MKSRTGVAGLSGTTLEFSARFSDAFGAIVEQADRPDLPSVLGDHSVGGDGQRSSCAVEEDGRAASVKDRVAVQSAQGSGLVNLSPAVTRIRHPLWGLDSKPAVALNGEIKRIVGLYEPAEAPRYEIRAVRDVAHLGVAGLGYFLLERHAGRPIANGVHVGDVVGDGLEPLLERDLSREGDIKSVLHDAVPTRPEATPAFRGNDGSAGLSVADFAARQLRVSLAPQILMCVRSGSEFLNFAIGLVITVGCILGGYAALGGHLEVLFQPFEFVIIMGSSLGIFIVANAMSTIKDCGKAFMEAVLDRAPKPRDFLDVLSALHALMRELRAKSRSEVEAHFDNPQESEIFKNFPKLLADKDLVTFICDYGRLIIIGNARPHEIEALMDEEIETLAYDRYKPVHAFQAVADGLPALGIVAAVLGIIHAMGALDQSPEILGGLIGAALVGTFAGIFLSYAILAPIAQKIKTVRQKQLRLFTLVKQSLLAFMNGAMPQVAVEFGRKTIPSKERPTIDVVENETTSGGASGGEAAIREAA